MRSAGSAEVRSRLLIACWPELNAIPRTVVGEPWTESALAALSQRSGRPGDVAFRIRRLALEQGCLGAEASRADGKLRERRIIRGEPGATCWITVAAEAEVEAAGATAVVVLAREGMSQVQRWVPCLDRFYGRDDVCRLLDELKDETGLARLTDAEFIIDVGFGVGNRDGYEAVIVPLEQALRQAGVRSLMVGGSRKVTEELHLLPADRQIGQSGVSVRPRVLLAIGISGAPQHLNYIGPGTIIVAFNRDPEAPIMTLNQRQPRPRVFPVVGDLFETVPALVAALAQERPEAAESAEALGGTAVTAVAREAAAH
jgi:hypothetical protein